MSDTKKKLNIAYPIIVEGKYDKIRILSVCNAHVIPTDGFGIFKKAEQLSLIKQLAARSPIILLTDSDGAGKVIRSHITSAIPKERIIQLYIPQIKGKERRKAEPSAEGTLGVEGMENDLLYSLLAPYENDGAINRAQSNPISKTDFYIDGLMGGENSKNARDILASRLGLPAGMSANALLSAIKILISYEDYLDLVQRKKETK